MQLNKILLTLLAFTINANAEIVVVTGYGDSYEIALKNAKVLALQEVVGTFIISDTSWKSNENVFEEIKQYNGCLLYTSPSPRD